MSRHNKHYILLPNRTIKEVDMITWAKWFEADKSRLLCRTTVKDVMISTVFLGLDHSFYDDGPPVLFETMMFPQTHEAMENPKLDFQDRYTSYADAMAGHERACNLANSYQSNLWATILHSLSTFKNQMVNLWNKL